MKKQIAGMGAAALAWLLMQTAATSITLGGCSSDDQGAPDASEDANADVFVDPCSLFTHSGDTCTVRTATACFPECDIGGCFCLETSKPGVSRWACQTDLSCLPDGSPVDDASAPDVVTANDAADDDAGDDDASDASDGSNADPSDAGSSDAALDADAAD